MPILYHPEFKFEVDWNGDDYLSADADIFRDVLSITLTDGALIAAGAREVVPTSAFGNVSLHNRDLRYAAEGPTAFEPDNQTLRRPCRLTADGVLLWSGLADPVTLTHEFRSLSIARVQLHGLLFERLAENVDAYLTAGSTIDLEWPLFAQRAGITVGDDPVNATEIGVLTYVDQPLRRAAADYARFADGYVFERHNGRLQLISPRAIAAQTPTVIDLTEARQAADGLIVFNRSYVEQRTDLVRNQLQAAIRRLTPAADAEVIKSISEEMPPETIFTRTYPLSGVQGGAITAAGWTVVPSTFSNGDPIPLTDPFNVLAIARVIASTDTSATVEFYNASPTTATYTANLAAVVTRIEEDQIYELNYGWSQRRYDVQLIQTPPWHAAGTSIYDHLIWARRQLNRLQHPVFYGRLTLPLWQPTEALSAVVAGIRPGSVVEIDERDVSGGELLRRRMLVLQCDYSIRPQAAMPRLTVHALELPVSFEDEQWIGTTGVSMAGRNTVAAGP